MTNCPHNEVIHSVDHMCEPVVDHPVWVLHVRGELWAPDKNLAWVPLRVGSPDKDEVLMLILGSFIGKWGVSHPSPLVWVPPGKSTRIIEIKLCTN